MTLSVYMWRSVFCDLWMFRRGSSKSKQKTHHHLVPKSLWDLHSACFHRVLSRIPDQFDLKSQIRPRTKQLEKSIGQYFLLFFSKNVVSIASSERGSRDTPQHFAVSVHCTDLHTDQEKYLRMTPMGWPTFYETQWTILSKMTCQLKQIRYSHKT